MSARLVVLGCLGAACLAILVPSTVTGAPGALPRATKDRPDDRRGPQVHALYVLPSNGSDRGLDKDGTIAASVANWQGWLRSQTGGRGLHLDTFRGELDVTFHRLRTSNSALARRGVFIRDAIEAELKKAGYDKPGKLYAVYYDGSNTAACGGGAWPPTLPGNVGAIYMRATYDKGLLCYDPVVSLQELQIMDFAMLHELLHTMGIVPTCAPRHTRAGHVSDSPKDLMYAGSKDWYPSVLDVGRNDYFNAPIRGCLDLADSPLLERRKPN